MRIDGVKLRCGVFARLAVFAACVLTLAGVATAVQEGGAAPDVDAASVGEGATTPDDTTGEAAGEAAVGERLRARVQGPISEAPIGTVGELYLGDLGEFDPERDFELEIELSGFGAGVSLATLSRHFDDVDQRMEALQSGVTREGHFVVQNGVDGGQGWFGGQNLRLRPYGVVGVEIDGAFVNLFGESARGMYWRAETGDDGALRLVAEIEDGAGEVVARVIRRWELDPGSFTAVVRQRFVNLTDEPMDVRWIQEGPVNLREDRGGYRIPLQRVRVAWLDPRAAANGEEVVREDDELLALGKAIDRYEGGYGPGASGSQYVLWPNAREWGERSGDALVWIAQTDRFFSASAMPLPAEGELVSLAGGREVVRALPATGGARALALAAEVRPLALYVDTPNRFTLTKTDDPGLRHARFIARLISPSYEVEPGVELALDFAAYMGPMDSEEIEGSLPAVTEPVAMAKVVEYNLGGPIACCTFPWLGRLLLYVLDFFHSFTLDWAISIVLLVVCVRIVLHPITKKSQVSLMRFGKQMQRIGPKQKKLQERYKDDPKKMREEVQKLMREEGINPAGALGCLPMFLQTPIWIALYAMLYMLVDLRHEPAFYGFFQSLTGGQWGFLADLSKGDSIAPLPFSFDVPLMGTIATLNILPILMGVLFFIQQKYMTPPPSAQMSPEMQTQQKIMKVMLVVMMPVFLYNAPSALTLYFLTNSTLGILESRYIRNHVDQLESDLETHGVKTVRELKKRKKVQNKARPISDTFKD